MRSAVIGTLVIAIVLGGWIATQGLITANNGTAVDNVTARPLVSNRNNPRGPQRRLLVSYLVEEGNSEPDSELMAASAFDGLAECEIESIRVGDPNSGAWDACERNVMQETGTQDAFGRLFREYVSQYAVAR